MLVAVLLLAGCWVDAGRPPGWSTATSIDINKAGVVAVSAQADGGRSQSFLLMSAGVWTPIGMESQDTVYAIDESGNAVGSSTSLSGDGRACAAIWPAGEPGRCLSPPGGGLQSGWATDINDDGVAVGQRGDLPVLWTRTGRLRTLRLSRPTDTWGRVEAINSQGVMVGMVGASESQFDGRAVRWDRPTSRPVELEVDPGAIESLVWAISDNGVMVGYVTDATGRSRSVVWRPDGSLRELPEPGIAYAVSDLDAPVGAVQVDGRSRAAVFNPETLLPTIVGPEGRDSIASDADGTHIAGWINDPDTNGINVALFTHPSFDP